MAGTALKPAAKLVQYLEASPTPCMIHFLLFTFEKYKADLLHSVHVRLVDHAVHNAVKRLEASGFTRLSERDAWDLKPNGRYFATR